MHICMTVFIWFIWLLCWSQAQSQHQRPLILACQRISVTHNTLYIVRMHVLCHLTYTVSVVSPLLYYFSMCLPLQSRSPKHGPSSQPSVADQVDHISLASLESLDAMSEADAPTAFTRGSRVRASLPVVRSTNQTKDRSLGTLCIKLLGLWFLSSCLPQNFSVSFFVILFLT